MNLQLQHQLQLRTSYSSMKKVAEMMKYSTCQAAKAANRIHMVINSKNLGLDAGGYDFKYSDSEFILKLCEVLGLDALECFDQIEYLNTQLFEYRIAYKPWLYVDTDFHRTTEPVHALAFMEPHRRILLLDSARLPLHEQIEMVKSLIVQHFEHNDGKLPLWGNIQRYRYFHAEKQSITFDIDGNVVEAGEDSVQPPAKITVDGADLTKVIKVGGNSQ